MRKIQKYCVSHDDCDVLNDLVIWYLLPLLLLCTLYYTRYSNSFCRICLEPTDSSPVIEKGVEKDFYTPNCHSSGNTSA